MNRQNWLYICVISAVALLLAIPALTTEAIQATHWKAFFTLIALSMAAQVVSSAMPKRRLHIPKMIFFFMGVLLLRPLLILALILLITIVDWEHDRREGNPSVRDRYLLPLSISLHVSAAFATYWVLAFLQVDPLWVLSMRAVVVIILAALTYATVHHVIGRGQTLSQGLDWEESGLFDIDTLFIKVALLFIGYGLAILWVANPWLLLIGLIPGLYYYQIHVIPALKIEAYTDAKTGLSNMRHFDELFQTELGRASRMNLPLSIIMVDVDDLGLINNTYGHLTGDGALLTVSEQIRLQISKNDIAARLGGEEFAIVLTETNMKAAAEFAETLRKEIEASRFEITNQQSQSQTTVSIGVATFPQHGITTLELIHSADIAMYQAKNLGKNQVTLADDVKEIIDSTTGGQESTEILNYRAAYSLSKEENIVEGEERAPSTVLRSSATFSLHETLEVTQRLDEQHPQAQSSSGERRQNKAAHNGILAAATQAKIPPPLGTQTGHRAAVAFQSEAELFRNGNKQAIRPPHTGPNSQGHRHNDEHSTGHDPTPGATSNPLGSLEVDLGIDSAVTKYQSELLNGPPTTEVISGLRKQQGAIRLNDTQEQIPLFLVFPTILMALAVTGMGMFYSPQPINLLSLVVFAIVALIVQLLQHSMYESSTVSVSAAIILAGTLVEGMPGLLVTCIIVVLVHAIQNQTSLYKASFNWSTHILAGLAPLGVYLFSMAPQADNIMPLVLLTLLSAIIYFLIESSLVASAIGLAKKQNIIEIWDNNFRWLIVHYMVAGFIALSMALSFIALGAWGIIAFAMPILLIYFAQKQYVVRTEQSTRKLNHMNRELSKANNAISTANRSFQRLTDELFMILSKIIDARDPDVHGHAAQVADYAEAIAHELGIKQDEIEKVRHGALLHDIGKIGISELILQKPGPLTENEYETIKNHPVLGADFLETCQSLRSLAPYVRHHHEWWNGQGYPSALYQDQIPLGARIIAVCDAVEAMTSDRPYRKGLPLSQVISELEKGKGIQFDPLVIDAFIKVLRREGKGYLQNTAGQNTLDPQIA